MRRRFLPHPAAALVAVLLAFSGAARPEELAGIFMPDRLEVEGRNLLLNGLGLREATIFKVDVYVAGLYLERKTSDPEDILALTQALQIKMKFLRSVSRKDIVEAWDEGFEKHAGVDRRFYRDGLQSLDGWMSDMSKGDTMTYTYLAHEATLRVEVNDEIQGLIPGPEFTRSFLRVWIGPNVTWNKLKRGLLGAQLAK